MFSLQSFQPQLVVPLGQAASLLSTGIRNVTQNFLASRSCRPSQTQVPRAASTAADDVPAVDVTEEMRCTARELGLCDLPEGVKIEALTLLSHQAPPSGSTNTYTSAQSFFENKHGFQEGQLWDLTFGAPQMGSVKVTLPHLSQGLFNSIGISTEYQQRRGFKTKRSRVTGLGQTRQRQREEDDGQPLFRKYFKDSVFERMTTGRTKSERFKSLLSDHEQNPEVQDKLKVAFAEGYAAHDRRESEQINSWARRGFRLLWYAIILWCVFQIFQAYSAIGGNMKGLNVLKGERYEVNPEEILVTFGDVKGVDEAKQELQDVVEYLKMPEKFKKLGAKLPKGVLLVGPPGIGKTLLARAVAGEAGVPFFHASGSEFDEIFVGTGAKRVRQLFDAAKMRAPCVIFIDEIDTVGAKRTSSQIHPYANQTINQLLSEMDGFEQNEGVIVLGATNRRDNLDKALLRPGRFDVEVRVFPPDFKGRREILELYLQKIKYDKTCNLDKLARGTTGFTGADLENLVNQAALKAAMDNADIVDMGHLEFARDKVLMGPAKKTKIHDEETNKITAYHEAGHTLVAYYTKDAKPLHKVTIIPRGMSLGHTSFLPEKEEYNLNKSQLLAEMDVSMGGRVAEEIVFGQDKVTTGAASDFSMATNIATSMVKRFGMSEKVGVRVFDDNDAFDSGLSMLKVNDVSPAITEMVDNEIKRMLQESYERAKHILKTHPKEHKDLADALLKYETLDADDIRAIIEGRKLNKSIAS